MMETERDYEKLVVNFYHTALQRRDSDLRTESREDMLIGITLRRFYSKIYWYVLLISASEIFVPFMWKHLGRRQLPSSAEQKRTIRITNRNNVRGRNLKYIVVIR